MSQSPVGACLAFVKNSIPIQLLNAALDPKKDHTTIDKKITDVIINGVVLQEINLVSGKRKIITLDDNWRLPINDPDAYSIFGSGIGASVYKIPPEARERRDINQVIGFTEDLTNVYSGSLYPAVGGSGNTTSAMMGSMLNSYTHAKDAVLPTLSSPQGSNLIHIFPQLLVSGTAITVLLEYDRDFNNMNVSAIKALRNLVLVATKRYIVNTLDVLVDEAQVSAGMEIGAIRRYIDKYSQDIESYDDYFLRCKGALLWDPTMLDKEISYRL